MFAISVTICEVVTFELLKYYRLESFTFKTNANVMSFNGYVADCAVGWQF